MGDIVDSEMCPNDAGRMVGQWWVELNRKFPNTDVDDFVVMPNHVHGIVRINPVGANLCVRPPVGLDGDLDDRSPVCSDVDPGGQGAHAGAPLHTIIQWFKTMTTNYYIRGVRQSGWRAFPGRLWQRNYYEHIIRNEAALHRIRQYIMDNPARWDEDDENPENWT